jgi:hypothetical protein
LPTRPYLFLAFCAAIIAAGCLTSGETLPDWMAHRPVHPDFLYGVGTCGRTREPEQARILAIERAVWEVCSQARGHFDGEIEFDEEYANGTVSLRILRQGRVQHALDGVQLIDEAFFQRSKEGFRQDTVVVLVRIPRSALNW